MKKILEFQDIWDSYSLKKLGRIMKCTLILLLIVSINMVASEAFSQKSNFSLKISNTTVEKVLDEIERQSDFVFLYSNELLDLQKNINLNVRLSLDRRTLDKSK